MTGSPTSAANHAIVDQQLIFAFVLLLFSEKNQTIQFIIGEIGLASLKIAAVGWLIELSSDELNGSMVEPVVIDHADDQSRVVSTMNMGDLVAVSLGDRPQMLA